MEPWRLNWQDAIQKQNKLLIPTDNFLNIEYACVSAIIGCSAIYALPEDRDRYYGQPLYFVIHNPKANSPLSKPWLPGAIEYNVSIFPNDEIVLNRIL